MRSRLLALALATTCLTPVRADAGPVAAFIGGAINAISGLAGGALAATGAAGAWSAGFQLGAFFTTGVGAIAGRVLLSVGLSALAASAMPEMPSPRPSDMMTNMSQPISYMRYVYGRCRVGGPNGFSKAKNGRRWYVPILAAHEIEGVVEHWIDEWTTSVASPGTFAAGNMNSSSQDPSVTAPSFFSYPDDGQTKSLGYVAPFLGAPGQTANPLLVAEFPEVTSAWDFKGLAGGVLYAVRTRPEKFSKYYPNGRQWVWAPVIDGHNNIYDPRDESTGYSRNAALIIANWLTEVMGQAVDWDEVAEEADASDVLETDRNGNTAPRWQIGGALSMAQSYEQQRQQLAIACDAFFYERPDGRVGFKVGRWIAPEITLTIDDFLSSDLQEGQPGSRPPNEIAVVYTEPDNRWREMPTGTYSLDIGDENPVREQPVATMATNHNQAFRIGYRILKAKRAKYRLSGTIGLIGYELIGQRFFAYDDPATGETINFEIGRLERTSVGTFDIEAVSVAAEDFSPVAADHEPARPEISTLEEESAIPVLSDVQAEAIDGGAMSVTWTNPGRLDLYQIVRWRVPDGEWTHTTAAPDATSVIITGLRDGQAYLVQAANSTNATGTGLVPEDWQPESAIEVTAVANASAPAAVADGTFTAAENGGDIDLAWTAPNDPDYSGARVLAVSQTGLVSDPAFADPAAWITGAGWSITGGQAVHTPGSVGWLRHAITFTAGAGYAVVVTASGVTAGSVNVLLWGSAGSTNIGAIDANGTVVLTGTAPAGATHLLFNPQSAFDGALDFAQVYADPVAADVSGASVLHTEYGAPGAAETWTYEGPGAGHYGLFLRSVNPSGVLSAATGPRIVTIT